MEMSAGAVGGWGWLGGCGGPDGCGELPGTAAGLGALTWIRLPSRLRCLVTNALTTWAATGAAAVAPQPPCSHSTATTMSGLRRGAMPTNQALARSAPVRSEE